MLWRGWLPVPTAWKGLTYGVVTLLTVGQLQFDRANPDFQIFEQVLMVLALFSLLFLVNGLLVGSLLGRFHPEPAYPRSVRVSRVVTGVIAVVCLLGIFAHTVSSYRSPKFSMVVLWFMHLKFDSRLFPSYSCWACVPP